MITQEINFNELDKKLFIGHNIIYGAGYNGKRLLEKLKENKVSVEAFYDDDPTRWGGGTKI